MKYRMTVDPTGADLKAVTSLLVTVPTRREEVTCCLAARVLWDLIAWVQIVPKQPCSLSREG
jgi:hypothetical protein